jgi:hypothetical protein
MAVIAGANAFLAFALYIAVSSKVQPTQYIAE